MAIAKSNRNRLRQLERVAVPDDPNYQSGVEFAPIRRPSRPRFSFMAAVVDGLQSIGARRGGPYGWQLDTIGGLLDITPYENWVACRFDDVERANEAIHFGCLNHYSGKWNWHYLDKPTANDVALLISNLRRIQLVPRQDGDN